MVQYRIWTCLKLWKIEYEWIYHYSILHMCRAYSSLVYWNEVISKSAWGVFLPPTPTFWKSLYVSKTNPTTSRVTWCLWTRPQRQKLFWSLPVALKPLKGQVLTKKCTMWSLFDSTIGTILNLKKQLITTYGTLKNDWTMLWSWFYALDICKIVRDEIDTHNMS